MAFVYLICDLSAVLWSTVTFQLTVFGTGGWRTQRSGETIQIVVYRQVVGGGKLFYSNVNLG